MQRTHRVVLIEKNTHFQHLFAFPRFSVVPGFEHKAFIPYTKMFTGVSPDAAAVVQACAIEIHADRVVLDRGNPIPYEYLVIATGTKLPPPGSLPTSNKVEGIKFLREHQKQVEKAQRIVIIGGGAVGVREYFDSEKQCFSVYC